MKIDDKDIDKMLEEFNREEIKVPQILEDKLNERLNELKPKKKNRFIKSLVASIAILILSYSIIPDFKTFADNVFKYIFGDVGVENAVNHGYENIPNQTLNINGYEVNIENIYMDNLRLVFDANVKINEDIPVDEFGDEAYEYSINLVKEGSSKNLNQCSLSIDHKSYDKNTKSFKSNVQIIANGKDSFLDVKDDKLIQKIELQKYYYDKNGTRKEDTLGNSQIILKIPQNLKDSRIININKSINTDRLNLDIESLEVSQTMMYLYTKGKLDKSYLINGLYKFKIISEENNVYKDNMTLSATCNEKGETKQTIVPSIYYDKSKKIKLKADGVTVAVKKDIKVDINNKNNRNLNYLDSNITIKDVFYKDGKLTIEIINNEDISHAGISTLEGKYVVEEYQKGNDILGFVFETDEKEEYNIQLELIMKYKTPIEIDIKK